MKAWVVNGKVHPTGSVAYVFRSFLVVADSRVEAMSIVWQMHGGTDLHVVEATRGFCTAIVEGVPFDVKVGR